MNRTAIIRPFAAVAALGLVGQALAQPAPERIPIDQVRTIGGVDFACTGIGQEKADPRWNAFPVRVEFSDQQAALIADETLAVLDRGGAALASVACEGPWILLRPAAPGPYTVKGWSPGSGAGPQTAHFTIPGHGQTRIEMRFPAAH
ncbi:MAG TPA: hypothetical protein VIJ59_04525 [Caulobacteraceae bacterium]